MPRLSSASAQRELAGSTCTLSAHIGGNYQYYSTSVHLKPVSSKCPPIHALDPQEQLYCLGFQPPACPPHTLHLVPPTPSPMVPVLQPAKVRSPFVVYNSHTLCSWTVARLATLEHHRCRKQLTPLFRWWCSLWPGLAVRRLLSVHDSVGDYRLHLLIS